MINDYDDSKKIKTNEAVMKKDLLETNKREADLICAKGTRELTKE